MCWLPPFCVWFSTTVAWAPEHMSAVSLFLFAHAETQRRITVKADYQSTFKVAAKGKQEHRKSEQTWKNYSGHVCHGIEFLANFAREEQEAEEIWQNAKDGSNHLSVKNENEIPTDSEAQMDPNFHCTFTALRLGVPRQQLSCSWPINALPRNVELWRPQPCMPHSLITMLKCK